MHGVPPRLVISQVVAHVAPVVDDERAINAGRALQGIEETIERATVMFGFSPISTTNKVTGGPE